jgi:hypothetical protein
MLTLTLEPGEATLEAAARKLGLEERELDPDFGVVEIDPAAHRYTVLVDEGAAEQASRVPGVDGPYANPRIEPFGPPHP